MNQLSEQQEKGTKAEEEDDDDVLSIVLNGERIRDL